MHRQKVKKMPIRSDNTFQVREDGPLFKFQILEIEWVPSRDTVVNSHD